METDGRGLNAVTIGEKAFLLTSAGADAVHLTPVSRPGESGWAAVPDHYLSSPRRRSALVIRGYDLSLLAARRWAEKTLCGRRWGAMVSNDSKPVGEFGHVEAFAPTCGRCLALMDKFFPDPRPEERLPLVVQVITDLIMERGCAEIGDVPGDQQAALRKRVRAAVRERTGHGIRTMASDGIVNFVCEPIFEQHKARYLRAAAEAVSRVLTGEPGSPEDLPRRLSWDTWSVG